MVSILGAFSGYSIDDEERALAFYRDTLGLPVTSTPMGLELDLPGTRVFLYAKPDHEPATFTVLNLRVADIDAVVDQLAAAGVELLRYDGMPQDARGVLRGRELGRGPDIAWFADPSGNIVSVLAE